VCHEQRPLDPEPVQSFPDLPRLRAGCAVEAWTQAEAVAGSVDCGDAAKDREGFERTGEPVVARGERSVDEHDVGTFPGLHRVQRAAGAEIDGADVHGRGNGKA
jgi:hypothetical protein